MSDSSNSYKIVVVGASGVGKTAIVNQLVNKNFKEEGQPTIGVEFKSYSLQADSENVKLQIWDTAGQERFHALTPLYARSSYCAIIMTSINDRGSFESINTWKELLQTSCERYPPCILSVNKIDLEDSIGADRNKIDQEYSDQFDCVMYVSALSGEGIDNLFIYAAQIGYDFFKKNTAKKKTMDIKETKKNGCC